MTKSLWFSSDSGTPPPEPPPQAARAAPAALIPARTCRRESAVGKVALIVVPFVRSRPLIAACSPAAASGGPQCPPVVTRLTLTIVIRGVERATSRKDHGATRSRTG